MSGRPLFVYGTLLCPEVWALIVGPPARRRVAWLVDHRRGPIVGEVYPGALPERGARIEGALVEGLDGPARARLDVYEGPLYRRVSVAVALAGGGLADAETYLVEDAQRALVGAGEWSLAAFRAGALVAFLAELRGELGR
ncbi:MAG: gamma-glutamylcyclotransferase [Myxococcales bacterium]|nr:gamma-glutamylcyclotransferase [Myxococcales bacterium]